MPTTMDLAKPEDFPLVEALVQNALLPVEGLRDHFPNGYVLARKGGQLVGVAGLEEYGFVGLLRSVVVSAELRNQGLGRSLVQDRIARARKNRLAAVYLLTTGAAPFFRTLGFADSDRGTLPRALSAAAEFSRGVCPASASCLMLMIE